MQTPQPTLHNANARKWRQSGTNTNTLNQNNSPCHWERTPIKSNEGKCPRDGQTICNIATVQWLKHCALACANGICWQNCAVPLQLCIVEPVQNAQRATLQHLRTLIAMPDGTANGTPKSDRIGTNSQRTNKKVATLQWCIDCGHVRWKMPMARAGKNAACHCNVAAWNAFNIHNVLCRQRLTSLTTWFDGAIDALQ